MTDFQINDYLLDKECTGIAKDAMFEAVENGGCDRDDFDAIREFADEYIHETADGHEWTIYTYKAHMVAAHCNTSQGEEFLEDIGGPGPDATYDSIATMIVYGEIRQRSMECLEEIIEEAEEAEEAA